MRCCVLSVVAQWWAVESLARLQHADAQEHSVEVQSQQALNRRDTDKLLCVHRCKYQGKVTDPRKLFMLCSAILETLYVWWRSE